MTEYIETIPVTGESVEQTQRRILLEIVEYYETELHSAIERREADQAELERVQERLTVLEQVQAQVTSHWWWRYMRRIALRP